MSTFECNLFTGKSSSDNVSDTGVPIPYAKNETLFSMTVPASNDSDHCRPATSLKNTSHDLYDDEIVQLMYIPCSCQTERNTHEPANSQVDAQKITQVGTFGNVSRAEHDDGVCEQVKSVQKTQIGFAVFCVEWFPAWYTFAGVKLQCVVMGFMAVPIQLIGNDRNGSA